MQHRPAKMPAMRILMVSDVYFPRINGVSTSIETFRHALAEHDIEVDVVAPCYPAAHDDDGRITRIPSRRVPFDPEDHLMAFGALQRVLASNGNRHDLVHVQTPFAAHYAGLRHARRNGIHCIATYHTHFEEYLHNYLPVVPKGMLRSFARRLARSQCNALDAVIVPSSAMQDTLKSYGVTAPLHRVPTGIPLKHFRRPPGTDFAGAFRTRHAIPADRPVALFVGRAAHEKNIGLLLEALPHALRNCPGLILVIAGDGPALPALRRQADALGITASTRFVGYLDRACELPACYAAADLFVFASRTETQGLVLLEAMAAGLPVLALAELGTREIVEPRRGALPAPQTPCEFGAAMAALLNDPAQRQRMAAAAVAFTAEWSTEACARRLARVYRHTLRSPDAQS
jgi:glycosyltransferase involved in cell wall biosynthesis